MTYRKVPIILLFALSFTVIVAGGYQCSQQVQNRFPGGAPDPNRLAPPPTNYDGLYDDSDEGYDRRDSRNDNRNDNRSNRRSRRDRYYHGSNCDRARHKELADRYGGELAVFKFDKGSINDFIGGQINYPPKCPRIVLSMSSQNYKGDLKIIYTRDGKEKKISFNSGLSEEDNKYNEWSRGSWREDRRERVDKKFHAIFEDNAGAKGPQTAIILKIEDVRLREVRDGARDYLGAGEIYYKMFRADTKSDDVCHSRGAYIWTLPQRPSKKRACWFISHGPYSCLPQGVLPVPKSGKPLPAPPIDITGDLPCYNRLGVFWGLEIMTAFDVRDVRDLK